MELDFGALVVHLRLGFLVGTKLAAKLTAKRGAVAIGKVVPFGIGAVVGGGFFPAGVNGTLNSSAAS